MRIVARTILLSIFVCALVCSGACKKKTEQAPGAKAKSAPPTTSQQVKPPKELLVTMGVKDPAQTIDDGLALLSQFVPMLLTRDGLLDLFAQRAKLPRELIAAIEIGKPFWLLGLNNRLIKDKDPAVIVLPIRSKKSFEAALGKRLNKAGTKGKLTIYKPKPGEVGQQEVKLWITETHVIAPSSAAALEVTEAYITGQLLGQRPAHDLEVRVLMEHIIKDRGDDLDKGFGQAMDRMRSNIGRSPGPVDKKQVASATEQTLRRYVDAVKSTRELLIAADVNRDQLTVTLSGEGLPGGRLQKLIKRQQVGDPFGYKLLPASSWLVLSDHGNPEAAAEGKRTWEPLLKEMLKNPKLKPALRERMLSAATKSADAFTGDFSLALHRAPSGAGLTLSAVGKVADPEQAEQALTDLAGALGQWLEVALKESGGEALKGLRVERKPLQLAGAKGELFRLHLKLPPEKRAQLERMVGVPLSFGLAFVDGNGLGAAGKGAKQQLQRMVDMARSGQTSGSLAENAAFERARKAADGRTGLLYVSLVDLARWFEGTGHEEMEAIAEAIREARVESAPSLDWGVDTDRTKLDFTLRLPAAHFKVFKPILRELQKRRRAWPGAKPAWKDL